MAEAEMSGQDMNKPGIFHSYHAMLNISLLLLEEVITDRLQHEQFPSCEVSDPKTAICAHSIEQQRAQGTRLSVIGACILQMTIRTKRGKIKAGKRLYL